jgi:acyl-coenzyme A synthetase/AMP-(fatty) acid ligase
MESVSDLLTGPGDPGRVVAITQGKVADVARLRRDVATNARRLVEAGCRCGLLMTADTYWAAVGMLALFQAGAEVVMPQNATIGSVASIRQHWDTLVCDRLPAGCEVGFILAEGDDEGAELRPLDTAQCHLSFFTSGSTGDPKKVVKSLAGMELEAAAIEAVLGGLVDSGARVLGTVTHQHLFGFSYKLFWPLCSGRVIEGVVHEFWESLLAQELNGAAIITSPAHLLRLAAFGPLPAGRRPACILSAGAVLPLAAGVAAAAMFGAPVCEIYGSTETGTIAWRRRDVVDLPWRAVPGVTVDIADDGRLCLQSSFVMGADPVLSDDLAERATDHGFWLRGRSDRIVKIDGKRVSLVEVEEQLGALPLVAKAAVVVLPGDLPTLGAVIVPSDLGRKALLEAGAFRFGRQLRQALGDQQDAAGRPRRWRFVDALPSNAMGKTLQQDLLALFADARPSEPELRALRQTEEGVELDLYNTPTLKQLDGHFPGMPIIPGVAQIDWAVKFAARHLNLSFDVAKAYQVKFHRLTLPDTMVTLKLMHDAKRQRLTFSYQRGEVVLTSGTIRTMSS